METVELVEVLLVEQALSSMIQMIFMGGYTFVLQVNSSYEFNENLNKIFVAGKKNGVSLSDLFITVCAYLSFVLDLSTMDPF